MQDPAPAAATLRAETVGLELTLVRPGVFRMGSSDGLEGEAPPHEVAVAQPFYLAVHPVTQQQFEQVMGINPSCFRGADLPVDNVSWEDAQEFCQRLSAAEHAQYRLPTEAEWEFACRAGASTAYHFGEAAADLGQYAWYEGNSGGATHPVGQKRPNRWGLRDMHGGLWEWCQSLFRPYPYRADDGREGLDVAGPRVLRGGSWYEFADVCRAACRVGHAQVCCLSFYGFRVARPVA